jgi:hypothetical protein
MGGQGLDYGDKLWAIVNHSNEPLGFIKYGEFLGYLKNYHLLRKECATRRQLHEYSFSVSCLLPQT